MGDTQENCVTCQNGQNPPLKVPSSAKDTKDVGGSVLGLQKGGRQFTKRWKSQCLVNKCLLGAKHRQ